MGGPRLLEMGEKALSRPVFVRPRDRPAKTGAPPFASLLYCLSFCVRRVQRQENHAQYRNKKRR
jgi:hypothetical protein